MKQQVENRASTDCLFQILSISRLYLPGSSPDSTLEDMDTAYIAKEFYIILHVFCYRNLTRAELWDHDAFHDYSHSTRGLIWYLSAA